MRAREPLEVPQDPLPIGCDDGGKRRYGKESRGSRDTPNPPLKAGYINLLRLGINFARKRRHLGSDTLDASLGSSMAQSLADRGKAEVHPDKRVPHLGEGVVQAINTSYQRFHTGIITVTTSPAKSSRRAAAA